MPFKEQLARAKARSAFLRLVRRGLALASLAVVLHQQAFMVRRRQKVVPLHLAVSGAVAWAGDYSPGDGGTGGGTGGGDGDGESGGWGASGSSLRSGYASWPGAVHAASRALLTPLEYMQGGSTRTAAGAPRSTHSLYNFGTPTFEALPAELCRTRHSCEEGPPQIAT